MKKIFEDLKLGFCLAFCAKSIKADTIFYLIALGLGFVMLTGSAIAQNTYDNGFAMCYGVMAYVMGCMGIMSDYNGSLFSNYLLTCPRAKQLQIKISLEMSMALCLVGFTLISLVELLFARGCSGDVLLYISQFIAFMGILTSGSRKRYGWTVLIVLIPMLMIITGGMCYFLSGSAIKDFSVKNCLLWETWLFSFFREKTWRAIATGYLVLLAAGGLQYLELRYWWKKDGNSLYYALKKNTV